MNFNSNHPRLLPTVVIAYFDSNLASCKGSCHSTISYVMFLRPNLVGRQSTKKHIISKSSIEDEYRVVGYMVIETILICMFPFDLGVTTAQLV